MEEKNLNEQESLELISEMISFTKKKMKKTSSIPFLIWGYITVLVSLSIWYLINRTHNPQLHLLWCLIPILGYPITYLLMRNKKIGAKTYIDKVISYIWLIFGISAILVGVATFFIQIPILFIIALLISMGTAITALVIQYMPLLILGFISMIGAFFLLKIDGLDKILVFAGIFFILMILPGHLLQLKNKKNNV